MLYILKAIVASVVLMLVGTNLIGFIVRGIVEIWSRPSVDAPTDRVAELLRHEYRRMGVANWAMTSLSILVTAAYLFALFHFWNVWLAVAGVIVMVSRIPDLIWEIRTGDRVTRTRRPKGPVYIVASVFFWGSLLLIWYSLCERSP
jgi:hypothetical protein